MVNYLRRISEYMIRRRCPKHNTVSTVLLNKCRDATPEEVRSGNTDFGSGLTHCLLRSNTYTYSTIYVWIYIGNILVTNTHY